MIVPKIDLRLQYETIKLEIDQVIHEVLTSGQFILGEKVQNFEKAMAIYCGVKYTCGVASGTDGLVLALRALGIGAGDEVIVPAFSFLATASSVLHVNATPVFVDIDSDTYNIDPVQIEQAITSRTKAIIPVHLYGQPADMDKIQSIAKKHKLIIIEDACQAIGAKYKGKSVGNFGDAAILSFYPTKNLGAYGDSGMILTNEPEVIEKVQVLRNHGMTSKYYHSILGYNSRMDAIQGAVLNVKLRYLDEWNLKRQQIADQYNSLLNGLVSQEVVELPTLMSDVTHVFHQYVIKVKDRDDLAQYLLEKGIGVEIYYPICLHLQPCLAFLNYHHGQLPITEFAAKSVLALPVDPLLSEEQIRYVVENIKAFYQSRK